MEKKRVKNNFSDNDKKLKRFISNKDELSESRIRFYDIVFDDLYELDYGTPSEIVDKCLDDQKIFLDNGIPVKKEINDRFVSELQTDYYENLKKQKNRQGKPLSKRTIQTKISSLRHFLDKYNVELPDAPEIKIKKTRVRDNEIPSWDDVDLAIKYAKSPRDKAIIGFAATTGFRVSDIANLKIHHLIRGCSIYFEENEEHTLENLLNKNPENICPCWDMDPQKTIWHCNLAITFNTPEVSVLLWQYLKYRIELNVRNKRSEIISEDEPLFHSQTGGHLDPITISTKCLDINKKMGGELDRNGVFGKFRIHNLRSLFKTTCKRNLYKINVDSDMPFDGDVVNLFTGHSSDNAHADVYEAVPEDSPDSYVRKVYEGLIPYLSISRPTEVKSYSTKEYQEVEEYKKEVEEKFKTQEIIYQRDMDNKDKLISNIIEEKDKEIAELKAQLKQTNKTIKDLDKKIDQSRTNIPFHKVRDVIINYLSNIGELNNDRESLLDLMVLDYAKKHPNEFKTTPEYLYDLIRKFDIQIELSNKDILEQKDELAKNIEFEKVDPLMISFIDELLTIIKNNDGVMKRVGNVDMIKFDYIAEEYLVELDLDYSKSISEDEKIRMANEILIKYLEN